MDRRDLDNVHLQPPRQNANSTLRNLHESDVRLEEQAVEEHCQDSPRAVPGKIDGLIKDSDISPPFHPLSGSPKEWTSVSSTSFPVSSTHQLIGDHINRPRSNSPPKFPGLSAILQRLTAAERLRDTHATRSDYLGRRIEIAITAHGQQIQQMAVLEQALEERRRGIQRDEEARHNSILLQNEAQEEIKALLGLLTAGNAKSMHT